MSSGKVCLYRAMAPTPTPTRPRDHRSVYPYKHDFIYSYNKTVTELNLYFTYIFLVKGFFLKLDTEN